MAKIFDVEEYDPDTIKDIFKKIEGYTKTIPSNKGKYPRCITYTISKGEMIITNLIEGPYKPSTMSNVASMGEIITFLNQYQQDMEDYYEAFRK